MARRLPPLNALRAFEAAARHLSFLKAADELHVTPGAVSQQVRALEDQLGVALFRRLPRGVLLTDAGQRFGRRIGDLLDGIAEATRDLKRDATISALTVSTVPSFAARWLIPRLGSFRAAHPDLALRVLAENHLTDFARDNVDLAIRFGQGHYPGVSSEFLFREEIFPVCSPRLLGGSPPLSRVEDLAHHTLLEDDPDNFNFDQTWEHWLETVGARGLQPAARLSFTYTHMALQAAAAGQGVALGTSVLAADDLALGTLVRPLAESCANRLGYWLVAPTEAAARPRARIFRDWLMAETERFSRLDIRPAAERG